jgi:hypothetical protein
MTKAKAGELAINTMLTVIGAIAVLVLSGAWSLKEDKAAHDRDVIELRALQQRTLDAVCDLAQRQPRACASSGGPP